MSNVKKMLIRTNCGHRETKRNPIFPSGSKTRTYSRTVLNRLNDANAELSIRHYSTFQALWTQCLMYTYSHWAKIKIKRWTMTRISLLDTMVRVQQFVFIVSENDTNSKRLNRLNETKQGHIWKQSKLLKSSYNAS